MISGVGSGGGGDRLLGFPRRSGISGGGQPSLLMALFMILRTILTSNTKPATLSELHNVMWLTNSNYLNVS